MPLWSPVRHELFFRSLENQIMVAEYGVNGDSFVPQKPRAWPGKGFAITGAENYSVAPDGRIAAPAPDERPEARRSRNHVIFLLNFFDELRRKVPLSGK